MLNELVVVVKKVLYQEINECLMQFSNCGGVYISTTTIDV